MKTRTFVIILILVLAVLIISGSCATTPETKEELETIFLVDPLLEEKPQEVKDAWYGYGVIMNIQIQSYYSQHKTIDDFKMTFESERNARGFLAGWWSEIKTESPGVSDKYLDELLAVETSGYLSEYVYVYYRQDFWHDIPDLKLDEFSEWAAENLKDHKVETLLRTIALPNN
ncbi:hypothetical protein LCGC14_2436530 [marine sediment metagenome]|uniref:Uncharacterized protein n=1 Tax=marine sediment metagenome TaxID=412755 RepID=A0A0F9BKA2_9ZZZZ